MGRLSSYHWLQFNCSFPYSIRRHEKYTHTLFEKEETTLINVCEENSFTIVQVETKQEILKKKIRHKQSKHNLFFFIKLMNFVNQWHWKIAIYMTSCDLWERFCTSRGFILLLDAHVKHIQITVMFWCGSMISLNSSRAIYWKDFHKNTHRVKSMVYNLANVSWEIFLKIVYILIKLENGIEFAILYC